MIYFHIKPALLRAVDALWHFNLLRAAAMILSMGTAIVNNKIVFLSMHFPYYNINQYYNITLH